MGERICHQESSAERIAGSSRASSRCRQGAVRVEHEVRLRDFTTWPEKPGGLSPREVSERQRIRANLGMPGSRFGGYSKLAMRLKKDGETLPPDGLGDSSNQPEWLNETIYREKI